MDKNALLYGKIAQINELINEELHTEKELLSRMAKGDEEAFKMIYQMYDRLLQPYLTRLTGSGENAGDLVQETMLRVWLYRERVSEMEYPRAYIFRIAGNRASSWLKKQLLRTTTEAEAAQWGEADEPESEMLLSVKAITKTVQEAIHQMPEQRRRIYIMNKTQGIKPADIASELHISVRTVNHTLYEAVKYIRECLKAAGYSIPLWFLSCFL